MNIKTDIGNWRTPAVIAFRVDFFTSSRSFDKSHSSRAWIKSYFTSFEELFDETFQLSWTTKHIGEKSPKVTKLLTKTLFFSFFIPLCRVESLKVLLRRASDNGGCKKLMSTLLAVVNKDSIPHAKNLLWKALKLNLLSKSSIIISCFEV